jgi:hypothetical protein
MSKMSYLRVFPLFGGFICHDFILKIYMLIFQWETKVTLGYFIASTLFRDKTLKLYWAHKEKTLKSQLLKSS